MRRRKIRDEEGRKKRGKKGIKKGRERKSNEMRKQTSASQKWRHLLHIYDPARERVRETCGGELMVEENMKTKS